MERSKRQIQKDNTRAKIIQAAYQVYSEYGFQATTSTIAKEASVSHGTIFSHFATLDELLIYLLDDFGSSIGIMLHDLSVTNDNIEELLRAHIRVLKEYEGFYIRLITESNLLPQSARASFISVQSTISFHFNIVVERDISKGLVKNIPSHMLFNTWVGLIHYYLQNKELFSPNASVLERCESELVETFLALINV